MTRGPTPEEYRAAQFLNWEREWAAGHLPALVDALVFAHVSNVPLPEWAVLAASNLVIERFNASKGRKNRNKYVVDWIHYLRWLALKGAFAERGIKYSKRRGRPQKAHTGIQAAQQEAIERLRMSKITRASTTRQVLASYDLVEAARSDPNNGRFRFNRVID